MLKHSRIGIHWDIVAAALVVGLYARGVDLSIIFVDRAINSLTNDSLAHVLDFNMVF